MAGIPLLRPLMRRVLFTIVLAGFGAARAAAQCALYAADGSNSKTYSLVRAAWGNSPVVMKNGKLKRVYDNNYATRKVDEYYPAFISIRDFNVRNHWVELVNTGAKINQTFEVHGVLESPFHLERVFLFLELDTADQGKVCYIQEVGDGTLEPRHPVWIDAAVPLASGLGQGRYRIHLFSDGMEVLSSQIPFDAREQVLDRMVRRRIKGVDNASPRPFVGPPPEYPPALKKSKKGGTVMLRLTIARNGSVQDPEIVNATDPAFGESALEAIRMWRFLPKIQDGRPVETMAELPFNFAPAP